jgi:hypothetical protein
MTEREGQSAQRSVVRGKRWNGPTRCPACGAPDSRDAAHCAGCPALPAVSQTARLRIALAAEAGWRAKTARAKAAAA